MRTILNRDNAYSFSNEELLQEICFRLRAVRLSSCMSQEEFSRKSGVSRSTIKRIESGTVDDIGIMTLMKLLRTGGMMDGFGDLIENVPVHPAINIKTGIRPYVSSKMRENYEKR